MRDSALTGFDQYGNKYTDEKARQSIIDRCNLMIREQAKVELTTGIEVSTDKSYMVKRNGHWKHELKFVGLKFNGKELRGNTRKGSNLLFNQEVKDFLRLEQTRLEQGVSIEDIPSVLKLIKEQDTNQSSIDLKKGTS